MATAATFSSIDDVRAHIERVAKSGATNWQAYTGTSRNTKNLFATNTPDDGDDYDDSIDGSFSKMDDILTDQIEKGVPFLIVFKRTPKDTHPISVLIKDDGQSNRQPQRRHAPNTQQPQNSGIGAIRDMLEFASILGLKPNTVDAEAIRREVQAEYELKAMREEIAQLKAAPREPKQKKQETWEKAIDKINENPVLSRSIAGIVEKLGTSAIASFTGQTYAQVAGLPTSTDEDDYDFYSNDEEADEDEEGDEKTPPKKAEITQEEMQQKLILQLQTIEQLFGKNAILVLEKMTTYLADNPAALAMIKTQIM